MSICKNLPNQYPFVQNGIVQHPYLVAEVPVARLELKRKIYGVSAITKTSILNPCSTFSIHLHVILIEPIARSVKEESR